MDHSDLVGMENEMMTAIMDAEGLALLVAETTSKYESLDEGRKAILAQLFNRTDSSLSDKKREMLAIDTNEYRNFLDGLGQANFNRIKNKLLYDVLMEKIGVLRSIYSMQKSLPK